MEDNITETVNSQGCCPWLP